MDGVVFENEWIYLTYDNLANILADLMVFLFVLGLIICTRAYRRRGRLSDKLYFAMLILVLIMAGANIVEEPFYYGSRFFITVWSVVTGTTARMVLANIVLCMVVLYLMCLMPEGESRVRKWYKLLALPALLYTILEIIDIVSAVLYSSADLPFINGIVDVISFCYHYRIMDIPEYFYILAIAVVLWFVNRKIILLMMMFLAVVLFVDKIYYMALPMTLIYAVIMVYLPVGEMSRSFSNAVAISKEER